MKKITREKLIIYQFILLSSMLSVIFCDDLFGMRLTTETLKTKENNRYRFHYFVKDEMTGDYKTQEETKDGDSVSGSYTVAEPNGDLRTVTYKAGPKTGFEAKVDVKPSASPMKTTLETTPTTATLTSDVKTTNWATTEKATTIESTVQHFPGGFIVDILKKPQSNQLTQPKTEMGMKFSLNTNFTTEPTTIEPSTKSTTSVKAKTTEKTDSPPETTRMTLPTTSTEELEILDAENSTDLRKIDELIEKELDEIEQSMPKLPELHFPDNKTHFKFYKDPEEAFLDERITQIARQLAETSLRKEYEERKLGHFIPISVTSIEPSLPSHLSKSFKFTGEDAPLFRPSQSPIHTLTHVKLVPQYIYKETLLPNYFLPNKRLPAPEKNIPTRGNDKLDQQTYEKVTNVPEILKINKSELQVKEINKILKLDGENHSINYNTETTSVQAPTSIKFFSPYTGSTQGTYVTNSKTEPQTYNTLLKEDLQTTKIPFNNIGTIHPPVRISNKLNITKV